MRTFERSQTITVDIAVDDPVTKVPVDPAEVVLSNVLLDGQTASVEVDIARVSTGHWRATFAADSLAVGSYLFQFRLSGVDPISGDPRVSLVEDRIVVTHTVFPTIGA